MLFSNVIKKFLMIFSETYQLSGFDEFATIPITYPLDICLMEVNLNLYAVCLGLIESQDRSKTVLKVLKNGVSVFMFYFSIARKNDTFK